MLRWLAVLLAVVPVLSACEHNGLSAGEGFVEVEGGRVWYRIVGSGKETPLLLLHGGPGAPSDYLNPLATLAKDRPVIFYDQLGSGRSDRPTDESLWRVERFVDELATLRESLGLESVHILGHSWGTMLAMDYMLTNPVGVESLILASPALSVRRWAEDADRLIDQLPEELQQAIEKHEAAKSTDHPEYQEATMEYYRRHLSRSDPWPTDLQLAFEHFNTDIYGLMWGPSEFTATGTLKDYEREKYLPQLDLPVLFTVGRYDEATPDTVEYFRSLVPGAQIAIFEESAHMTMLDEPLAYADIVGQFLGEVDRKR